MSDLVYHYCSIESFIKIVEGKSLKFSDIKKSNDDKEIELLWQYYSEYIEKNSSNPYVKSSLNYFKEEQMNATDFLVCCFSNTKDALHLWNCYANKGVAIGFRKDALIEWSKSIAFLNNGIYRREDKDNSFAIYDDVKYYEKSDIENFISEQCKGIELITNKFQDIFYKAPFCKTNFWEEEHEWRIVLPIIYSEKLDLSTIPDDVIVPETIDIKAALDSQFGFKTYCLVPIDTSMVEEIILAPNCSANVSDVSKILKANGFYLTDDQIIKSDGSLR